MSRKKSKRKRKSGKKALIIILALCLLAALLVLVRHRNAATEPGGVEHLGQVEVYNGGKNVWITPEKNVPVNDITQDDFARDESGALRYVGDAYKVRYGIDVSSHQGEIDWQQVKESGIDFAILRTGGRYYGGDGELYADERFAQNLQGAKDAGLKVGVYFFSQAISVEEARQEADTVLSQLDGAKLDLPVFVDWERVADPDARANYVGNETPTQCVLAFCERIRSGGYEAGLYFNLDTSYYGYTMSYLTDYTFWCASPGDYPYCYYAHSLWQYSFEGTVPGIDYACDLDMMFIKK